MSTHTEYKGEHPDGDVETNTAMDTKPDDESVKNASNNTNNTSSSPSQTTGLSSPDPDTVIVFDWDDTLLASSFLSSRGYRLDSEMEKSPEHDAVEQQLKELESAVSSLLTLALTYGAVHVVTNAETGWVQLSAQKFMPGLVPLLSRVSVLSARSTYEPMHPESPLKWKFFAFQEKLSLHYSGDYKSNGGKKNVISFGDSHVEREAVRAVTRTMSHTRCKSVKFAERPSTEQLRRQLELVTNCFHYIHQHDGDLDLQLTVTVNSPPPSPVVPVNSTVGSVAPPGHVEAPLTTSA
jgi:hypothetical protein